MNTSIQYELIAPAFFIFSKCMLGQNMGIGTSTPVEKLQVAGNILMDTAKLNAILLTLNAGSGKILTSDNVGNASWENVMTPPSPNTSNGNAGYRLDIWKNAGEALFFNFIVVSSIYHLT